MPRIQQILLQVLRRPQDPRKDHPEHLGRDAPLLQIDRKALPARHVKEQHGLSVQMLRPAGEKARDPVGRQHISLIGILVPAGSGNRDVGVIQYSLNRKCHDSPFPVSVFSAFAFRITLSGRTFS